MLQVYKHNNNNYGADRHRDNVRDVFIQSRFCNFSGFLNAFDEVKAKSGFELSF